MGVKWKVTDEEAVLIERIVDRAARLGQAGDSISLHMDITACHCNDRPLDLERMLDADDFNFLHDVHGIRRHIDRRTGKLTDCFVPRFAKRSTGEV